MSRRPQDRELALGRKPLSHPSARAPGVAVLLMAMAPGLCFSQERSVQTLGEEHQRFAQLVGEWGVFDGSRASVESPGQPMGSAEAVTRLGGRFLEIAVSLDGGPFENALYTLSFDDRHGEYAVILMDDSGSYFVTARGEPSPDGSVVRMHGTDDDPVITSMGFTKEFVIVLRFLSVDRFSLETLFIDTRTPERNEMPFLHLWFQR